MKQEEERPPFLGTWKRVYVVLAAYVVAVIALFTWFTRAFNR